MPCPLSVPACIALLPLQIVHRLRLFLSSAVHLISQAPHKYSTSAQQDAHIIMRSSTFLIATAAAVVRAQTPGDDVPINCAKPNANYCMEADIILRCDENAIGIPARCSPNLSGYPPAGGVASCWESGDEVGDAACEKNVSCRAPIRPSCCLQASADLSFL
jgi:hypothetical protein